MEHNHAGIQLDGSTPYERKQAMEDMVERGEVEPHETGKDTIYLLRKRE